MEKREEATLQKRAKLELEVTVRKLK